MMLKLYRFSADAKEYWETWDNGDGNFTVHWGELGTKGNHKIVKSSLFSNAEKKVKSEIDKSIAGGFQEIEMDEHSVLLVEYEVDGMGTGEDVEKRYRLQDRMGETLGWTGLGHCDGGSIGSGTMEVCNFVVDFELAKQVIEYDLVGTEFADYTRIYKER